MTRCSVLFAMIVATGCGGKPEVDGELDILEQAEIDPLTRFDRDSQGNPTEFPRIDWRLMEATCTLADLV